MFWRSFRWDCWGTRACRWGGSQPTTSRFDFFQRLAFGFRHAREDEKEPDGADGPIEPECARRSQRGIEQREGEGQQEACDPQRRHRHRYCKAANAVGENFGDEYPGDRRQRHGVTADGAQGEHQHGQSFQFEMVGQPQQDVRERDAGATDEHERPAAKTIHHAEGDQGADQVDGAGDHDIEQDAVDVVAGAAVDLFGVVEDDVDAAPLLQHGEEDADGQHLAQARNQQRAPRSDARFGIGGTRQPTRAFGDKACAHEEDDGGKGDRGEHPAPGVLAVPGLADELAGGARRHRPRDQPVGDLRDEDADHDGQLVEGHHAGRATPRG